MSLWSTARAVLGKEWRLEWRTRQVLPGVFLFALMTVLLCAFALDLHHIAPPVAAAGTLWLAVTFSGMLAISRSWHSERESGAWPHVVRAARSSAGLFLGKALATAGFMLLAQVLLLPLLALFFPVDPWPHLPLLLPLLAVSTLAFAASGTLFGALTLRGGAVELLFAAAWLPLATPVLVLAAKATALIFAGTPPDAPLALLRLNAALAILNTALGAALFGFVSSPHAD